MGFKFSPARTIGRYMERLEDMMSLTPVPRPQENTAINPTDTDSLLTKPFKRLSSVMTAQSPSKTEYDNKVDDYEVVIKKAKTSVPAPTNKQRIRKFGKPVNKSPKTIKSPAKAILKPELTGDLGKYSSDEEQDDSPVEAAPSCILSAQAEKSLPPSSTPDQTKSIAAKLHQREVIKAGKWSPSTSIPCSTNTINIELLLDNLGTSSSSNTDVGNNGDDISTVKPDKNSTILPNIMKGDKVTKGGQKKKVASSNAVAEIPKVMINNSKIKKRFSPHKTPKPKTSRNKFTDEQIPENPLEYQIVDKDGMPVKFGTNKFVQFMGNSGRLAPQTQLAYNREFNKFLKFTKTREGNALVEDMLESKVQAEVVSTWVGTYLSSRINLKDWREKGERNYLDTTTLELIFAKIVCVFKQRTNYDLYSPSFKSCREIKTKLLKDAKDIHGKGELNNQCQPLTRAQLCYLLHSDQLTLSTPRGLIWLFYVLFTTIFLPRVREEVIHVTRGDFQKIFNPDGSLRAVVYCPKGKLKRDRGDKRGDHAARVFKRPVALPIPLEPKLSFDVVLDTIFAHLDKLPWSGDRSTQPIFYQITQAALKPGDCFFNNKPMGLFTFDSLLRSALWAVGMKVGPLQFQNQALRPTAFGIHKALGLSTGLFQASAGHASERTHIIYCRKNIELLAQAAGNFQEAITGQKVQQPDFELVELEDVVTGRRELRKIKDFLPLVKNGRQEGLFPLSGMFLADLAAELPHVEIVDNDDTPVLYEDDGDSDQDVDDFDFS